MPWTIKKQDDNFCVVKDGDTEPIPGGCHANRKDAANHLQALYANKAMSIVEEFLSEEDDLGDNFEFSDKFAELQWEGPIVYENVVTGDNRVFKLNSITWESETLPWVLRWQKSSGQGHAGSVPVGRVDGVQRKEDGSIYGYGVIIPELNEEAAEYLRLLESGVGGGVSVDGDSATFEVLEQEGGQPRVEFSSMRLRALSAVDVPAFNGARIHLVGQPAVEDEESEEVEAALHGAKKKAKKKKMGYGWKFDGTILASAIPVKPSTNWFMDPTFDGPVPLTVTKEGQVFGYLALFNNCHIGFPGTCVKPPKGSNYQYFHTGQIETAEGDLVDCGKLTFKTGHAEMNASPRVAADHYDNTGTVAADVRAGEDAFGIWVVGALRPHLSDEDIRAFRAAPLSGDWRRIAGKLELVAALGVNTPGFPVPRVKALVASGETETLFTYLEEDNEEFVISDYELFLRLDKKLQLAVSIDKFLGEVLNPDIPGGKIEDEDLPPSLTKKDLQERADNYSKNQIYADLKLLRSLLDDTDENIPKKVREGAEELYKAFIKVDEKGKKFSVSGYDLGIIDASGLDYEEWETQLQLSGFNINEFYNRCHDENGRFCEGDDGPGRVRDNVVKGRHKAPSGPSHGTGGKSKADHDAEHEAYNASKGNKKGSSSSSSSSATVHNASYEKYRASITRVKGWAALGTIAALVLKSPVSGILTGITTAAGVGILGNPLTLGILFATASFQVGKNYVQGKRHRDDYNRQVDRKLRVDKAIKTAERIKQRALNS